MAISRVAAPLRQQVIAELRKAIATGDYRPGQRLVERDLCERLDVSRTVVREALRHLEAEGLVAMIANHGPVVATLTRDDAMNLYEVREALEQLAGRLCAERSTPALTRRLSAALKDFDETFAAGDMLAVINAKDAFYEVLFEGAGNPMIGSLLRSVQARIQVLRAVSLGVPGREAQTVAELKAVVKAIKAHDAGLAEDLLRTHVRNAAKNAIAQLDDSKQADVAV